MDGPSHVRKAHAALYLPMTCIDVVDNYTRLVVAPDFAANSGVTTWQFEEALKTIDALLADPNVGNADLKGMLNRIDVGWGVQSPVDAREHIKAARDAFAAWIANND